MGVHNLIIDKKPAVIDNSPILEYSDGRIFWVSGLYTTTQAPDFPAVVFVLLPESLAGVLSHYLGCQIAIRDRVSNRQTPAVVAGTATAGPPFLQVSKPVLDFFGLGDKESAHMFEVNLFPGTPAQVNGEIYHLV